MSYHGKAGSNQHHRVLVSRLMRLCMDGELTYKEAARTHPPIIVLLAYLQRESISQSELARRLGTHQSIVSRVLTGLDVPDLPLRARIEAVCLIPVESWDRAWKAA